MAPVPTFLYATYLDNANRRSTIAYRMATEAEDDGSNIAAVLADAAALETALNVLTEGQIEVTELRIQVGGGGAAPNIHANNQNVAFTRVFTGAGKSSFEVPSWDDTVYSQDSNNLLSAAYNTAAQDVADLLLDPETGDAMAAVQFTQARTRRGARHIN